MTNILYQPYANLVLSSGCEPLRQKCGIITCYFLHFFLHLSWDLNVLV